MHTTSANSQHHLRSSVTMLQHSHLTLKFPLADLQDEHLLTKLAGYDLSSIGVGTRGQRGARLRNAEIAGRKYLFALALVCQVYLLVDSQIYISICSFKILNLIKNLIMYSQSTRYIFLSELHEACKSIILYTRIL